MIKKVFIKKKIFEFKYPLKTSKETINNKISYFIILISNNKFGIGECSPININDIKYMKKYENILLYIKNNINKNRNILYNISLYCSSIYFGLEQAFLTFDKNSLILFPSDFTNGKSYIKINNLISINNIKNIYFNNCKVIKIKMGIMDFYTEYKILKSFVYNNPKIKIILDFNGKIPIKKIFKILNILSSISNIKLIEQPITKGQLKIMSIICKKSPIPIALDEEIHGIIDLNKKKYLLDKVMPKYIVLKPSLCWGIIGIKTWISEADKRKISWWMTSFLESNIAINIISQLAYYFNSSVTHGLSTGLIYKNNIESPLIINNSKIWYNNNYKWNSLLKIFNLK